MNIQGAEDFGLDAAKIGGIVAQSLNQAGIATDGSGIGTPMVNVDIDGESTGGGGARYTVELVVRATESSPFAQNHNAEVIFWRALVKSSVMERYDPIAKAIVKPTDPVDERVYHSVQLVSTRLAEAIKRANLENK